MKILPVDLNETENFNFAGLEVDFLQLNGNIVWEKSLEQVGLDLNYTGLDVNGKMEGEFDFDGTIVAYAVGKPKITYYKEIVPTPTTKEGYYGYYVMLADGSFLLITEETTSNIRWGEAACYTTVVDKESADSDYVSIPGCSGYNSEYYGGYDFITSQTGGMTQVVPDVLKIPSTYNNLPVTKILDSAFMGTVVVPGSQSTSRRQGEYIKDIVFGKNIKEIGMSAFAGLRRFGLLGDDNIKTTFSIPEGVEKIGSTMFNRSADLNNSFSTFILPTTITEFKGNFIVNSTLKTIVYKCENATSTTSGYLTNEYNSAKQSNHDVVFKKSVKKLNNTPFYNTIADNLIFEHTDEDEITINISGPKSAKSTNIYTDSAYVRSYDWAGKNITPTFYSLSEYTGELE